MRIIRHLAMLFVSLGCLMFASASVALADDDDWGPIDPAELALKSPKVEKDADAEVLFWEVRVDDGPQGELVTSNHVRIKIFTERGKNSLSKLDVPYFDYSKIKDIGARTIKPDGTIIELKKVDVFERIIVKAGGVKLKVKSFAMPGLEPGAIIEYRWRNVSGGRWANHMRLDFQREIPVQRVTYYVRPERSSLGMRYIPSRVPDSVRFVKGDDGFYSVTMTNVPALREEPYMPPDNEVRSSMLIYYTADTSTPTDAYWKGIGEYYDGVLKYWSKADNEVKKASATIIGDAVTQENKLERLFLFCQTKIQDSYDDASALTAEQRAKLKPNKSPSDTLKRRMGTGSDIDMLFASLAIAAGFDVRLALTANRNEVFFNSNVGSSFFLQQSSIAVRVGDEWRFFNPSLTYSPYGMLPWPAEGQQALISDPNQLIWAKTPVSSPNKSKEKHIAKLTLSEDGTLEGDVHIEYTGQMAMEWKEYNDDSSPAEQEASLRYMVRSRIDTAEVSNIHLENVKDPFKPLVYEYHVRIPGYAQRTGKRLFLQPAYFQHGIAAAFASSIRKYSIYFHYPWSEEDEVIIESPVGYDFDIADAPTPFSTSGVSEYSATMGISKDKKTLTYKRTFVFGENEALLFPPASYQVLRQYFDQVYKADNQTIVLKQEATTAQPTTK